MREQIGHAYDGCDCCERFGQDPSTCDNKFCDVCDGPCRGVKWEPLPPKRVFDDQVDPAKLARDQLISGAARFMESGGPFRTLPHKVDREDFSHCAPPPKFGTSTHFGAMECETQRIVAYDKDTSTFTLESGPFSVPFTPAEGAGDTVIPINRHKGRLDVFESPWCPTGKLKHIEPMPPATPAVDFGAMDDKWRRAGLSERYFDGSLPPGISTDPFKSPVDAMPDTPLQRVRKATIKALEAGLELNEALEALETYQRVAA